MLLSSATVVDLFQTEQRRGNDAIGHLKRIRGISIVKNVGHQDHPIVKLSDDLHEPIRAAKLRHDLPESRLTVSKAFVRSTKVI